MGDTAVEAVLDVVCNLALPVLLSMSFIDTFLKSTSTLLPMQKVVRYNFRLVPILVFKDQPKE